MCSIGEDDFGDDGGVHAMVPETDVASTQVSQGLCNKCGHNGDVYKLNFRAAECRDCFLAYARHKFRATLGSSKLLPRNAQVLLVFDGSAEAVVLLDMLHHAQTQNQHKRLHCSVRVVHIDDWLLLHPQTPVDQHREHILALSDFLNRYEHFESFIMPMGSGREMQPPVSLQDPSAYFSSTVDSDFANIVTRIHSLTSSQDYVKLQRNRLLAHAASYFGCEFVFLSDISTALAAQLLSAVVLGRGGSAALDVSLVDDRLGHNIKLVRPLKDLNATEVQLYLRAQQLSALQTRRYGTSQGSTASLQNLTTAFVDDLQKNFSSTVSTVFRTGDKIAANRQLGEHLAALTIAEENDRSPMTTASCAFCNSPLDYSDSTTLLAIEFSRIVSETGCSIDLCPDLDASARTKLQGANTKKSRRFCHACSNIQVECATNGNLFNRI